MIYHSVFLTFKAEVDQAQQDNFFEEAKKLAEIPGVREFECLREISPKNNFQYGLIMQFENENDYQAYTNHPKHVGFVENVWIPSVADFQEIDYIKIP